MLFSQNFLQLSLFVGEYTLCVEKEQKEVENEVTDESAYFSFPFHSTVVHAAFRFFAGRDLQCLQL